MRKSRAVTIEHAERKFKQAEFFLRHLERDPYEIAMQLRSARAESSGESLEYFFSAFLSAANTTKDLLHMIQDPAIQEQLKKESTTLKNELERANLLDTPEGVPLLEMKEFRNSDTHGTGHGADTEATMIPYDFRHSGEIEFGDNPCLYGGYTADDPNGRTPPVAMIGSLALSITYKGRKFDATTVCRQLLNQLRTLLDNVRTAQQPSVQMKEGVRQ